MLVQASHSVDLLLQDIAILEGPLDVPRHVFLIIAWNTDASIPHDFALDVPISLILGFARIPELLNICFEVPELVFGWQKGKLALLLAFQNLLELVVCFHNADSSCLKFGSPFLDELVALTCKTIQQILIGAALRYESPPVWREVCEAGTESTLAEVV